MIITIVFSKTIKKYMGKSTWTLKDELQADN
jgi:hypothetical protein